MYTAEGTRRGASSGSSPRGLRQTSASSTSCGWLRVESHWATPEFVVPRSSAQPAMRAIAYPGTLTVPPAQRLTEGMGQPEADAEAVARVRSGDQDAFRFLVERHTNAVYRLACRMTGNAHDAEDVVQETFLRAFRRLDDFEERAQFGSWLHRIAANCSYDLLRARAREQARRRSGENEAGEPIEHAVPSTAPGPERLAAGSELRRRVQAAMRRMSALERAAFTLRHLEGHSISEIEAALGLDTSAAKQSIFRAVRKLRQALGEPDAHLVGMKA